MRERREGPLVAQTYFTSANQDLAPAYLDAVIRYLKLYSELFGPYPFPKFAVVENFFPTGYGFPSYTLLGSTILRLPFILSTSLGHEIAHCWWGNGVQVDYESGQLERSADHLRLGLPLRRRGRARGRPGTTACRPSATTRRSSLRPRICPSRGLPAAPTRSRAPSATTRA